MAEPSPPLRDLEQRLSSILTQQPQLYSPNWNRAFPVKAEVFPHDSEVQKTRVVSVLMLNEYGYFFNQLYLLKMEKMFKVIKEKLLTPGGPIVELDYIPNVQSFVDLRKHALRFQALPNEEVKYFEDKQNHHETDWSPLLEELVSRFNEKHPTLKEDIKSRGRFYGTLIELSAEFDHFLATEISRRKLEKGDKDEQLALNWCYTNFLDNITGSDNLPGYPLRLLRALKRFVRIGKLSYNKENENFASLDSDLEVFSASLRPRYINVHFNEDWRENYGTKMGACVFKGDSKPWASLLWSIDPGTTMMFFDSSEKDDPAQAMTILFDAEDLSGSKYLVLEGIITNKPFLSRDVCDAEKYVCALNPKLKMRNGMLDLCLYHTIKLAVARGKDLFINLRHVTRTEEYGPQELISYLPQIFPELDYDNEIILVAKKEGQSQKRLVVTDEPPSDFYLRKDNSLLKSILESKGIALPPELVSSEGNMMLLNHTWGNPRDENTYINPCEGNVYGKILRLEEMKEIIRLFQQPVL